MAIKVSWFQDRHLAAKETLKTNLRLV